MHIDISIDICLLIFLFIYLFFHGSDRMASGTFCTDLFLSFGIFRHFQPRFDICLLIARFVYTTDQVFPQREGLHAVYIPGWRSTTRGTTTCHLVGTPGFLLEDCIRLPFGVEIIFTADNINTCQYHAILDGKSCFFGGCIHNVREGPRPMASCLVYKTSYKMLLKQ